ncbi:MAG: SDR family oxidoreductase [Saprospiraceae bacterium]|nr:SDR family oxidoreductase [Saprospiraceae bacterium]
MATTLKKTALVTGAAKGIGSEMARLMARQDYNLILVDLKESLLLDLKKSILDTSPEIDVQLLCLDLCQDDAAASIHAQLKEASKTVNVLINNAGFGTLGFFHEIDWDRERRMIRLHVETLTHLTKLFLKDMIEGGSGRILNVASVAGFQPSPLMAVYNATKAYILSFSEAIANEVAGTGVTVTVLCPGLTRTGFQATVGAGDPAFTKNQLYSSSAEEVARFGINAMLRGRTVAVPGIMNKIFTTAYRFLPRKMVTRMLRKIQEKNRSFLTKAQSDHPA